MPRISRIGTSSALRELTERQHGVVSREQLRDLGLSDDSIDRAIQRGELHPVFHGAFALGRAQIGYRGRLLAATLACGPGAVVSHLTAAALLGLLDRGPMVIDVIATGGRGRGIEGIRAHQVRHPRREEIVLAHSIPCTSAARTKVDLAGTVSDRTMRSCFERSAARGILDLDAVEAAIGPGPRRGAPALRRLIAEWREAEAIASGGRLNSPLEAKILPLLARRGLPPPVPNARVRTVDGSIEVDFLWPDEKVVLEADSRAFHSAPVAFERDRRRDRELARVGYATLRATHLQAETEAEAIAATLEALLRERAGPKGRASR